MVDNMNIKILQSLYDYNRIPLWIFDSNLELHQLYISDISISVKEKLTTHIKNLIANITTPDFDILCFENELYYLFSYTQNQQTYYLFGGPMLLTGFYHITEMHNLSFAKAMNSKEIKSLVEHLPVVTFATFSSCLRVMMLLLKQVAPSIEDIQTYKSTNLPHAIHRTFVSELFDNIEEMRGHTPYSHEIAVLNCVKNGDLTNLEAIYKTLPQTKYGNMSNNPLKQLFYGCIANTTLVTRYAIEGGLEEETAFTLSDVYIKQMEKCRNLYELTIINEKMAVDFTARVAEAKTAKVCHYSRAISKSMDYILREIHKKISLNDLAKEVGLTPKYLSVLFHKETNQTLSNYIMAQKIKEAKRLLTYSDYRYSQISQSLSFSSQSYFIATFKKILGITPKEFREQTR